jgi:hypothetical protein
VPHVVIAIEAQDDQLSMAYTHNDAPEKVQRRLAKLIVVEVPAG